MKIHRLLVAAFFASALASTSDAGEWVKDRMTNAAGTRAFELYVPSGIRADEKRPLLVGIHGCTQTAADFAGLTRAAQLADQQRILLLLPEQSPAANPSRCWNWFLEDNQKRGEGEPSLIKGMVDWVRSRYKVDDSRIYVMGVSSGGYMTSILLSCYADVFAAGAVASGGMYEGAKDLMTAAFVAGHGSALDPNIAGNDAYRCSGSVHPRLMPVLVFDGSVDPYVAGANGRQIVAAFAQMNDRGDDGIDNDSFTNGAASKNSDVAPGGLSYAWESFVLGNATLIQHYVVAAMGHAWSGGDPKFAYAEPRGPDETAIIWSFLEGHRRAVEKKTKRKVVVH